MVSTLNPGQVLTAMERRELRVECDSTATPYDACGIYQMLSEFPDSKHSRRVSARFLKEQLDRASGLPHDFPADPQTLQTWMEQKAFEVGRHYADYLEKRKQGGSRHYFSNRSHALSYLQQVAPVKLVDGAWLYGLLPYWKDVRFHGLIRTYLEELGDGDPDQNHALLFKRLLIANDCEALPPLGNEHYVQGAIQLAFAKNAEQFLPELIGYNLGYEQLPLHLLISSFELGELDIDPYYFTLHITIDNASTGHANKAVGAVLENLPKAGDIATFWQRVRNGYQLNDLGLGTSEIVRSFDLEPELVSMLERKRVFGQHLHSDYSVIGGSTVNEWLSAPGQMKNFLDSMVAKQWIQRNQDPKQSRFWRLIEGPKAPMAGVFNGYEKQLLHDWIAGEFIAPESKKARRVFPRYRDASAPEGSAIPAADGMLDAMDAEESTLRSSLRSLKGAKRAEHLIPFLSPARHMTAAGLLATREFSEILRGMQT